MSYQRIRRWIFVAFPFFNGLKAWVVFGLLVEELEEKSFWSRKKAQLFAIFPRRIEQGPEIGGIRGNLIGNFANGDLFCELWC